MVAALVSTLLYTVLGSHGPVIASLQAEPGGVAPAGSCQIVCDARGSGELSYDWSVTAGTIDGEGATVTWTAPISAGSYNVTVVVTDGRGSETTGQVSIKVRANHAPTIKSLSGDKVWTTPSGSIELTCVAADPDHDELSYVWTADGGDILGTGSVIDWTAPHETRVYTITVVVKDGYGGEDTDFVPLAVDNGAPPAVEKLVVTPKGYPYLRKSTTPGCDFDVWKGSPSNLTKYDIECVASGTGGLTYSWFCKEGDGQISGEGQKITWTAPNKESEGTVSVDVTVMVTVSDAAGDKIAEKVVFYMASCSCGTWGLNPGEISF